MKPGSELLETSSGKRPGPSMSLSSIYDVPGAILDARELALALRKNPSAGTLDEMIDLLSASIRIMGREDIGEITGEND